MSNTCSFAVYNHGTSTPAKSLDTGSFSIDGASNGKLTIKNTGNQPLKPKIRALNTGEPWGARPTIAPGEAKDVTVIWDLSSGEMARIISRTQPTCK